MVKQKYTFNIGTTKQVLMRGYNESDEHIVLKLVSYLLFQDKNPKIEAYADQHYKPDLVCKSGHDIVLWIDCGTTKLKKLDKVATKNHKAEIYIVKSTEKETTAFKSIADKRIKHPERIKYICFDQDFINGIVDNLQKNNDLTYSITESTIRLEINGTVLESKIIRLV